MRIAICDDEKQERQLIIDWLQQENISKFDIDEYGSADDLLRAIQGGRNFNLIYLDIEMPGSNGFSLLENLPEIHFEVIFVTAYDHYGIQAIKFSALDYILKPTDIDELIQAITKAKKKISTQAENRQMLHLLQNNKLPDKHKTPALSLADKIEFIEIGSIVRCKAENNYTTFYLKDGQQLVVSKTLKEFDELLVPYHFLRVHQSHLINLNEMKSYIKSDGGYIRMKDGSSVSISRQQKE